MYYLQSRYFDPGVGRFINADDAGYLGADGNLQSYNLFAYCGNSPVNRIDPYGEFNLIGTLIGGAILAVGIACIVATAGAATPAVGATLAAAAGMSLTATGTIVAYGAATDSTMVADITGTVLSQRLGSSYVIDFHNNTFEVYSHYGETTRTAYAFSYSIGFVQEYTGQDSYGGEFVQVDASYYSYCQSPRELPFQGVRADCISFSFGSLQHNFSLSYDYYESRLFMKF